MRRLLMLLLCAALPTFAFAYSIVIDHSVDSHDNLFYTDWGHWFTAPGDQGLNQPGSQAAQAVQFGGGGFNFADFSSISISASGIAQQDALAGFNADGVCVSNCGGLYFGGSNLRAPNLTAYSLIGIWSKSATEIDPFYTDDHGWRDIDSGLGLLLIGSSRELQVPDFSSAYLFLAVNDGGFADNAGGYDVRISASVPEPTPLALLAVGLLAVTLIRRRLG